MKTIGIRRMLTVLCAAGLLCGVLGSVTGCGAETAVGTDMPGSETETEAVGKLSPIDFDNSALIPAILPEDQVKMETTDRLSTPDWFKSVIMVELRIGTATPEGTFEAAIPLLDHYAEMGVNCLWLTPIYEHGIGGNGYGNYGLHTLEPSLTGTNDIDEGWEVVRHFVDEAHARNIRVLFDIVTWGTMKSAPLIEEHPEFFSGGEAWGNAAFDWSSKELKEWFIGQAVDNILRTGADGYRCDCEPNYAGYKVFGEIRDRLLEKGRKIVLLAEDGNARKNAFEVEMDSVLDFTLRTRGLQYQDPMHFYLDDYNIVDSVKTGVGIGMQTLQENKKSGQSRFYTFCVSNHDYQWRVVNSNRLVIGYQALFAPFIPYWYMGDECGVTMDYQAVLYDIPVDAELIEDEAFYGDVKQMIRIRRTYPDIFEYFPDDHRKSNICAVKTSGLTKLQSYARYMGDHGIMIIPNYEKNADGSFEAVIPYGDMKLSGGVYRLTDLLTGEVLGEGEQGTLASFTGVVPYEHIGVYLIQKIS